MKLSIVTPSLNQGVFIRDCLDSVASQSYRPIEHRVVDAGSNDSTLTVLETFAPSIGYEFHWTSEPDDGQADAINKGFKSISGDVVGWLNSDDRLAPDALELVAQHFRDHPDCVMVYGEGLFIDREGRTTGRYPTKKIATAADLLSGCHVCQPTVFMRREALAAVGMLNTSLHLCFDYELWIRFAQRFEGRIHFLPKVLAHSRVHAETKTSANRMLGVVEAMRVAAAQFGRAPHHWVESFVEESLDIPLAVRGCGATSNYRPLLRAAARYLDRSDYLAVRCRLRSDARVAAIRRGVFVDLTPDGWLTGSTWLRPVNHTANCDGHLRIAGRHALPVGRPLNLAMFQGENMIFHRQLLPGDRAEATVHVTGSPAAPMLLLVADCGWRPCDLYRGSTDDRELSFRVEAVSWSNRTDQRILVDI